MNRLRQPDPQRLERFAHENRRDLTAAESAMVVILSELGWRFNIEHPKAKQNAIVDFFVPRHNLIIEVDGGYHLTRRDKDKARDKTFVRRGCLVQRFSNDQVLNFPRKTKATLLKRIQKPVALYPATILPAAKRVRGPFVPAPPAVVYEAKP